MGAIVHDAEELVEQHLHLLRAEVHDELQKVKGATVSLGAGAGLLGMSGIFSGLMLVHFLHRYTRLPLWACYGLVGGLLHAGGYGLMTSGVRKAAVVHWALPQTTESLKEIVAWLKDPMTYEQAVRKR